MPYDPQRHHRRSIRLKGYDYTQPGAYFITLVTYQRECLFDKISAGKMQPSATGMRVAYDWEHIPEHFPSASLDEWIIMPNHLHGIILLSTGEASADKIIGDLISLPADASPRHPIGTTSGSIGAILQNFKSITSRKINQAAGSPGAPLWQRNYYEHIIRNKQEWERISDYIRINPLRWEEDQIHPSALSNPIHRE
jgi:putative transposase